MFNPYVRRRSACIQRSSPQHRQDDRHKSSSRIHPIRIEQGWRRMYLQAA